MEFNLETVLMELISKDKIEVAILMAERELSRYEETAFTEIIGKNLLHQIHDLEKYLKSFILKTSNRISLKSVYGEMNGFSINYDLWFLDLFGFDFLGEMENLDWLADWEDENSTKRSFVIKGFEGIQKTYQLHHENKMYTNQRNAEAADICDYVIVLRLQELFRETIKKAKRENQPWAEIPILVTAHDYELVYRMN